MRRVVYVSGAPGAGKSTLAGALAAELGYALIGKDIIKETLDDVLREALTGPAPADLGWSRALGGASMELLWTLAALSPAVVIEANFRPYSAYERERLAALGGRTVEVHCACPPEVAAARYNARVTHPVHVITTRPVAARAEYDRPVGIGDLVTVDTTRPVDVADVAARVRACQGDGGRAA